MPEQRTLDYAPVETQRSDQFDIAGWFYASSMLSVLPLLAVADYRRVVIANSGNWCGTLVASAECMLVTAAVVPLIICILGILFGLYCDCNWKSLRGLLLVAALNFLCVMMPQLWAIRDRMFPHY